MKRSNCLPTILFLGLCSSLCGLHASISPSPSGNESHWLAEDGAVIERSADHRAWLKITSDDGGGRVKQVIDSALTAADPVVVDLRIRPPVATGDLAKATLDILGASLFFFELEGEGQAFVWDRTMEKDAGIPAGLPFRLGDDQVAKDWIRLTLVATDGGTGSLYINEVPVARELAVEVIAGQRITIFPDRERAVFVDSVFADALPRHLAGSDGQIFRWIDEQAGATDPDSPASDEPKNPVLVEKTQDSSSLPGAGKAAPPKAPQVHEETLFLRTRSRGVVEVDTSDLRVRRRANAR